MAIRFDNHPLQYSLEMSKPEYFGWLLFSVGMLLHHFPRSYLYSLKTMQDDIRIKRMRAQERWSTIRRKSRLAIILSRFPMPRVTLTMVDKLEQYTNSLTSWIDSIERAGETDDGKIALTPLSCLSLSLSVLGSAPSSEDQNT